MKTSEPRQSRGKLDRPTETHARALTGATARSYIADEDDAREAARRPSGYAELLLVSVVLGAATAVIVFGAPLVPAIRGGLGFGALLYVAERIERLRRGS